MAESRQLDPFAFPSETKGRFLMLIVAALAFSANLGLVLTIVSGSLITSRELQETVTEVEKIRTMKPVDLFNMGSQDLDELSGRWLSLYTNRFVDHGYRVSLPLAFMSLLGTGAFILYRRYPERIRHRQEARLLRREEIPRISADLEEFCSRNGLAMPRLEVRSGLAQGHAFGLPGREILLLHGTPELLEKSWGGSLRAIILHELGHLANRDAHDREKARAVWITFIVLLAAVAGLLALLPIQLRAGWLVIEFIPVLAVTWMMWAGLIRIREFYADWQASSWGAGSELMKLLSLRERECFWWERSRLWWHAWERWNGYRWWEWLCRTSELLWCTGRLLWRAHPGFDQRREVLRNPSRLFGLTAELSFLTGLLLTLVSASALFLGWTFLLLVHIISGIASSTILSYAAKLTPGFWRDMLIASTAGINATVMFLAATGFLFFLSFLLTRTLGIQAQRQAVSHLARDSSGRWGYGRLVGPAFLLALGMEVGFWIAPLLALEPRNRLGFAAVPIWLGGFTLFAWLWLAYTYALSRFLLGTQTGKEKPYFRQGLVTAASSGLLTVLFWPAAFARLTISATLLLDSGISLPGISDLFDQRSLFVYGFFMSTIVLLVFAVTVYSLWCCFSLLLVWFGVLQRQRRCPACNEVTPFRMVLGRRCQGCGGDLSPWAFIRPEALRGGGARHAT